MKSSSVRARPVPRAAQHARVLDLAEAAVLDDAAVGASAGGFAGEDDLGGRARRVRDDDRPLAGLPDAPENCCVYASSQPSTASTPLARSSRQ